MCYEYGRWCLFFWLLTAVALSTIIKAYRDSAIIAAAWTNSFVWWSVLYARAQATLSNTSFWLSLYRSATYEDMKWCHHTIILLHFFKYYWNFRTANKRSGRNVPSVSMYKHFPSPPPWLIGNWHVTANVWHNCVLPVRNSPNISVIEPVSMPPPSNLSSSREPDVRYTISALLWWKSDADKNPIGTNFPASSNSLSTLASENPLISLKCMTMNKILLVSTDCEKISKIFENKFRFLYD